LTLQSLDTGPVSRYRSLAVFGVLLGCVLLLQLLSGAFGAELVDPDEPAHFISGLLVRDYLASGLRSSPLSFARDYYSHYPKVAIGNWPPLFHAIEGVWLLVTPVHPASVLVLLALMTAGLAWLIFLVLQRSVGVPHALLGAVLFVLMRHVPAYTSRIMIEMPMALVAAIAVWLFARYLDDPRMRWAAAFGAACVLAVLTKGNALFLALLVPLAILAGRRWSVLRKKELWIAALGVALIAGPWTWYFLSTAQAGWGQELPSLDFMSRAGSHYLRGLMRVLGPVALAFAAVGLWDRVLRRGSGGSADSTIWLCAAAVVPAVILFHMLVPAGIETRHMIPAYPALTMFVAAGTHRVAEALHTLVVGRRAASILVVGLVSIGFAAQAFQLPTKVFDGYGGAAEVVANRVAGGDAVISVIVSDVAGEGAYIVEAAIRDRNRPSHTVWRGTTLFSRGTWAGRRYRLRADDEAGVIQLLEQASVGVLVIDRSVTRFRHQRQIENVIAAYPDRFGLIEELPMRRAGERFERGVAVYELLPGPQWTPADVPQIRQVPGYDGIEQR
jgi:4-amino-4-deoxy-L-arabinose transferase-like glycosyltransferase